MEEEVRTCKRGHLLTVENRFPSGRGCKSCWRLRDAAKKQGKTLPSLSSPRYNTWEEAIAAKSTPDGDHIIWNGSYFNGYPVVTHRGSGMKSVRGVVYWLRTGKKSTKSTPHRVNCGNSKCIIFEHFSRESPAAHLPKDGRFSISYANGGVKEYFSERSRLSWIARQAAANQRHDNSVKAFASHQLISRIANSALREIHYSQPPWFSSEDIAQEVYLKMLTARRFKLASPKSFAIAAARNLAIDYSRVHRSCSGKKTLYIDQWRSEETYDFYLPDSTDIEREVGAKEELSKVMSNLSKLPPSQYACMSLFIDGNSQRDIVQLTGFKEEKVESCLRYARKALRSLIS